LSERPEDVAWIYRVDIQGGGAAGAMVKNQAVKVMGVDGKENHQIAVKLKHIDEILNVLAAVAPQATFGYSVELRREYKRDPRSLVNPMATAGAVASAQLPPPPATKVYHPRLVALVMLVGGAAVLGFMIAIGAMETAGRGSNRAIFLAGIAGISIGCGFVQLLWPPPARTDERDQRNWFSRANRAQKVLYCVGGFAGIVVVSTLIASRLG